MIPNALPQSLVEHPQLGQWLAFAPTGRVQVLTGKVELGQGILTALVQIAAEELDLSPDQIDLASGETDRTPDEGYTAGSLSIEVGGGSIRLACAEARSRLLELAAAALACPASALAVADGRILQDGEESGLDYWALAPGLDLAREVRGDAPVKALATLRRIGRDLPRRDLPAKVFGAAFIHDLAPEPLLHARILRQPWRGARLAGLDEAAVRRGARGSIEILRDGEFTAFLSGEETAAASAVASARDRAVWQGGEPLEPGYAETAWLETLPSVDRVVHEGEHGSAFAAGPALAATYSRPFLAHGSIGPSCALARHEGGRLTVLTHAQGVFPLRDAIARALGLDPASISVEHRQGSGCYGHNGADDAAFDAAFLALRRPGTWIRVLWTREDELSASPFGAAQRVTIRAQMRPDGRPAGWHLDVLGPTHVARPGAFGRINLLGADALPGRAPEPPTPDFPDDRGGGASRNAVALYDLPQHVTHRYIPRLLVRTSALRGLGAFANVFAIESFVDELAEAAGGDPMEYRLAMLSDPRARRVIERAAAMAGWGRTAETGSGRGKGLAFSRYKNRAAYLALVAEVEVDEAVRLTRIWCAADAGLVVNPDGARNQIEGGIIQGASWTLKEQVRFAEGRVSSDSWDSYPILRFSEIPAISLELVGDPTDPMLGVGECAQGPIAAAIGNAVARALGIRLRDLPLTRQRVMAAALSSD